MAYIRKTDDIDPERGDKIQLRKSDVDAVAELPKELGDPIFGAFVRWFVGGDDSLPDRMSNALLETLKNKQREEVRHYIETCNSRSPNKDKATQGGISRDKSTCEVNETKTNNESEPKNENETKEPGTAAVSPPSLDRVSVSSSEIDKAITAAAALLGDEHPSRVVWANFIQRHGLDAFNAQVNNAATNRNVEKRGAYLNTLLKVYTPPPPPPKPQKPRTFTKEDWTLCCERCANFDGKVCTKGIKTPPDKDLGHPHTPEECQSYKAKPQSETPPDRSAPSINFGATLKRVNVKR